MAKDGKSEQATPHRRKKAREEGQVARSRELSGALAILTALFVFAWTLPHELLTWRRFFRELMIYAGTQSIDTASPLLVWTAKASLSFICAPVLAGFGVALVASFAQGGFVFAPKALAFNGSRFNPATRLGQLFSLTAVATLGKALIPSAIVLYLAAGIFQREWGRWTLGSGASARTVTEYLGSLLLEIAWKAGLVMAIWATVDYLIVRFKFEDGLKMSRQDIRDELKQTDGNPQIKGRIRRLQRRIRRSRMLRDVAKASVVIVNPTHFSVALEYRPEMAAPIVLAKGLNSLAQQIKQAAIWNDVPVLENPPLAQALYKTVEVGQHIPPKLYVAVAEILAFVYRIQNQARQSGAKK